MGDPKRSDDAGLTEATREEERREAAATHAADRGPTPEEEREAPGRDDLDPSVAESYEEMTERGVAEQGEGRIP